MKNKRVEWDISLYRYNFSKQKALYPRVILRGTVSIYDLANELSRRTGSLPEVVCGILGSMETLTEEYLIEGYAVTTHLGTLAPSVTGMWNSNRLLPAARAQNKAVARFTMSKRLKKSLSNPLFQVLPNMEALPRIYDVRNTDAQAENREEWLPGDVLLIHGKFLLMNGEDPERGIYFINSETNEVVAHIPPEHIMLNKRSQMFVKVPQVAPGQYRLRVVSQCTTSPRPLRRPHVGDGLTVYSVGEAR